MTELRRIPGVTPVADHLAQVPAPDGALRDALRRLLPPVPTRDDAEPKKAAA